MPLQRVVERDALTNQPLAVVDQQPQVELGTCSCAAGSLARPSRNAALATAIASMLSDFPRSRPPRRASAINLVGTRRTRSPAQSGIARMSPRRGGSPRAAQTRSPSSARAQINNTPNPRTPTWTVFSPCSSPLVEPTAAIVCERLCMSAPSTIIGLSTFDLDLCGRPADTACLGRGHAPIKSRRTIPDRRRATQRKPVRPNGRQRESESARRRSDPLLRGRTSPPQSKQQA